MPLGNLIGTLEGLAYIPALAPDHGAPGAGRKPHERGQFRVLYVYTEVSNGGEKRRIASQNRVYMPDPTL